VLGGSRFLNRVQDLCERVAALPDGAAERDSPLARMTPRTIQRVTEDASRFHFHTAIAALMEFQKAVSEALESGAEKAGTVRQAVRILLQLLHPIAPHTTDEWWERMGENSLLIETRWPSFDAKLATPPRVTLVVQVNGKVRGKLDLERGAPESEALAQARSDEKIRPWVEGKTLERAVYVPDRLLNLVVR